MTFKLSPSSLNLLEDCPKCFYLHVVRKISRPSGAFPSLPSGVDKMLKEHFDRFMEREQLPPELSSLKEEKVKLFNNKELLKKWRNNFKGIEYYDNENDILLRGAVTKDIETGKSSRILIFGIIFGFLVVLGIGIWIGLKFKKKK